MTGEQLHQVYYDYMYNEANVQEYTWDELEEDQRLAWQAVARAARE